ncbi:MAG: hypothetical protein HY791_10335 [Deltaproteobacteria bacterium]|nr:hypothetical protein [Deltaproteobacteria bacterium]
MTKISPNAPHLSVPSRSAPSDLRSPEEVSVEKALAALHAAEEKFERAEVKAAHQGLSSDPAFGETIKAIGTVENAANALAVAMTYLREYPAGSLLPEHIKQKMVGHVGATTAISRTYVNAQAALNEPSVAALLDKIGVSQSHVVTGPGHGAAAIFALLFLEGSLEKIYPDRYPRNATGLQNLIADFCRPHSPLPSHVFPGVPSVSEGGELGYSFGIAAGAGLAHPEALIIGQIGDKESEAGPLQAAIENHNAVYDFRKGLVLPMVHANGLGISGSAIISARTDAELKLYLRGLGYAPFVVNAEDNEPMKRADKKAAELEPLYAKQKDNESKGTPDKKLDARVSGLEKEVRDLRQAGSDLTNAVMQRYVRQAVWNLGRKKELALELDDKGQQADALRKSLAPDDELGQARLRKLDGEVSALEQKLRDKKTPMIVYREAKGGGHAPAFVNGKATKGAPESHQLILSAKDLTAKDKGTRDILERWLSDLTGGKGPSGLLPETNPELSRAADKVMPLGDLRSGAAPLAVGRVDDPLKGRAADGYLVELAARGKDQRGGNEGIDAYLRDYLVDNKGKAFLLSADTAESNRLKKTVDTLGRRFNLPRGEHHPGTSGPRGEVIDTLSEQYLTSMAQGMVNSGRQAVISNYEAFFQISASMIRQYIKFRKQAAEANATAKKEGNPADFRPPVPNLVLHLSSIAFEQDHNGFSHQNPGLVDDLAAEPRAQVAVYMPPEANTATLHLAKALAGKGQVAAIVADKQPRAQFLKPEEAKELADTGAAAWAFASSVDPKKERPDVVLAASGGYHTDEVLAASQILFAFNDKLVKDGKKPIRFSTVNVAEPLKLRAPKDQDDLALKRLAVHGRKGAESTDATVLETATFDRLFPKNAAVVYNFGGFARTAEGLFTGRERTVSTHGYKNEGSTTTRFDMMTRNGCDRFSLVTDVVERVFKKGSIDRSTRDEIQAYCAKQLDAHDGRMKAGAAVDPPEITGGIWTRPTLG